VRAPEVLAEALEKFGGERVQLGVDARDGKVSVQGWNEDTALEAIEFARGWKARGVERVIFTDISRDGMMQGPNIAATREFVTGAGLKVTASGGVSCPADLTRLAALEPLGVDRAIVGKAIYEGAVRVEEVV
jgi:phosphoribosylformimino-5-aminoimidazole carboxamide ribotide isomerase